MKIWTWCFFSVLVISVRCLPPGLLYDYSVREAKYLPKENDVSSEEIKLKVPVVFYGTKFDSIYVNSNGFLSFQTEIPQFINIQFPLDYPIIAPFYSNVDTSRAGEISYYETDSPGILQRATENIHESFLDATRFQATSLFIATWQGVGYYKGGSDKVNTFQVVIATDGQQSYVEFLYPENGIQWIQGTGDESGLPDARAQAGFLSPDGKMFTLPGSGTEQVRNLEKWSNIGLSGQFLYRVDGADILEPDNNNEGNPTLEPVSCAQAPTSCHVQARCKDYEDGFCCECTEKYYGNGKFCVKKDVPLRVNGKVTGKINGEILENLDLQSYIVMADGRAYTAISKIPVSIGFDVQSLQILGGVIGYVFAKPVRGALNGYQLTGGVFNHSATITFLNTSQTVRVKQKYLGLDVFDQLRLEADIQGEIPNLPIDSRVRIDEYQEQYTQTRPGVIQMTSHRVFKYNDVTGEEITQVYTVDQTFLFDYCKFENKSVGETWILKVGKNYITYESREQIIRFGLSNKISPIGDFDPCEEGRTKCVPNSACVVDNESYRCICNPGFQHFYTENGTVCADINECQTGQYECDYNAQCVNTIGGYSCQCNPGFEGNGFVCDNAKSCDNVTCTENAECFEQHGYASCKCLPGFTGDGQICTPVADHSCHVANNCSPYGMCTINPETNAYYCACLPGYEGDGYWCNPLPTTTEYPSEHTAIETTTESSPENKEYEPWCPEGQKYDRWSNNCVPEETETNPSSDSCNVLNNCHPNAQCLYVSALDSYACTCNEGFEGDGYACEEEKVSCTKVDNCHPSATCTYDDNLGKSKCICNPGFEGDGYNCAVVAVCISNSDCTHTEECVFTSAQRYECVCKEGYARDSQHICVPLTGTCGGGTCVENAECVYDQDYETYFCNCKAGYVGDGITECRLKPVGCDTLNNCGLHATCNYDEAALTYVCKCQPGFFGDGFSCFLEKNCHVDPNMCDRNAACVTDAERRYVCQCNPGFVGDGAVCKEVSRHEGNFLLLNQGVATLKIPMEPSKKNLGRPIQIKAYQTAVGLDIDCQEGRMYWSDIYGRAIRSALLNGSNKVDFINTDVGSPEGLAVDWVSRNIYWTDSTYDTIEVANLDSKRRRKLFSTDLVNPRGIAVHPQRGKIFWTDWDRLHPKIEWANADGTNRQIFLEGEAVSLPNSLAIDYETDQICYTDAGTHKIECVHIDTKQRQTIAVNCTYPFGITVTDKLVYWSDWISKKIERADKYTHQRLTPLKVPLGGTGSKLYGLVAVPNRCPQLSNVCQYHKCPNEHICLPNGLGGRSCLCAQRSDAPDEKPSCTI